MDKPKFMQDDLWRFRGKISSVHYAPQLRRNLNTYAIEQFDINAAKHTFGVVTFGSETNSLGFSRWVSPKRTRSYPFDRMYATYHLPKKVTIIPIIKDEGLGGDCDRINFITLSLMNLLNIYVILAWYDDAQRHPKHPNKITGQRLPNAYIQNQLNTINRYHQSALHWNTAHFENEFVDVYTRAIERYQTLSQMLGVPMHTPESHIKRLAQYTQNSRFDARLFRNISLASSYEAAQREIITNHELEFLEGSTKAYFSITNWLGGEYHLTADEILQEGNTFVIQESKNSKHRGLPSRADITDGLFKLILFANMDTLYWQDQPVPFSTCLKLTGQFSGALTLPNTHEEIIKFLQKNTFTAPTSHLIYTLNQETAQNPPLQIILSGQS